ncbi:MAG: FlgB family protein [Pseudomonadota bacterium]
MFDNLEIIRIANGLARHSAARQTAVAENIANVNTPDYKQRDIPSFAALYGQEPDFAMKATHPRHIGANHDFAPPAPRVVRGAAEAPNGNSVSLEREIVKAADVRQHHDMALSIYESALTILRTSLGRR